MPFLVFLCQFTPLLLQRPHSFNLNCRSMCGFPSLALIAQTHSTLKGCQERATSCLLSAITVQLFCSGGISAFTGQWMLLIFPLLTRGCPSTSASFAKTTSFRNTIIPTSLQQQYGRNLHLGSITQAHASRESGGGKVYCANSPCAIASHT